MCKDLVFLCLLVGAIGAPQGGEFGDVDLPPGTGRMLDIKFIPPSKLQSPIFEVVDPHAFVSTYILSTQIKINNKYVSNLFVVTNFLNINYLYLTKNSGSFYFSRQIVHFCKA